MSQQNNTAGPQTLSIQQAIDLAMKHHAAGELSRAETLYTQILQAQPDQPVALHLLGVVAHQVGKFDIAGDLIGKALAINPVYAEAHNNLGNVYMAQNNIDAALTHYRDAVTLQPGFAEAHYNLGNAYQELNQLDDAVTSYHSAIDNNPRHAEAHNNLGLTLKKRNDWDAALGKYREAIAVKPDYAEAHNNLGNVLNDLNRNEEAVVSYTNAIAIRADYAEAHNNLGSALLKLHKTDAAETSYRKAVALKPDYAQAHNNLGLALRKQNKPDEALVFQRKAVALNPDDSRYWTGLAATLESLSFDRVDETLWPDLMAVLEWPTVRPSSLVLPLVSALRHHPGLKKTLELTASGRSAKPFEYTVTAEHLSAIGLLLKLMKLSPIYDLEIEHLMTTMRRALLADAIAGRNGAGGLAFSAALALQCLLNEYLFPESDDEKTSVETLQHKIETLIKNNAIVPPTFVCALAAYRPLHGFSWSRKLSIDAGSHALKEVVERHILEPAFEQSLRPQIPRLTAIRDGVSQTVRQQYEDNPYPRWVQTGLADRGRSISSVLSGEPLNLDLGDYLSPEKPEILVAGCGTGQHALGTASRFLDARVLAVDLSLSSLCYGARQTKALGISHIEYAQADIMEMANLKRRFDLIESVGVLHHLENPIFGWRNLVGLLRPGGFMHIGLYSKMAHEDIISGRDRIAEMGYTASPEDIRRCRQDLIAQAEGGNQRIAKLFEKKDFYSLSECRDLLFHTQEYRYSLPQIESLLFALDLEFLGFEIRGQQVQAKIDRFFPTPASKASLSQWHEFELENPDTFRGMYQFWCRKK